MQVQPRLKKLFLLLAFVAGLAQAKDTVSIRGGDRTYTVYLNTLIVPIIRSREPQPSLLVTIEDPNGISRFRFGALGCGTTQGQMGIVDSEGNALAKVHEWTESGDLVMDGLAMVICSRYLRALNRSGTQ